MKRRALRTTAVCMFLTLMACLAGGIGVVRGSEPADAGSEADKAAAASPPEERRERVSVTAHALHIGGKKLAYRATAGEMPVALEKGNTQGSFFYVAYEVQSQEDSRRPITFAFNGGPGAAAVWLHLGGLGPQQVMLTDDGRPLPAPAHYSDNPFTWLQFTDLVFIDPIGTGFSRAIPEKPGANRKFYGVQQDIESVAAFIRLYLTKNKRWLDPVFLVGESYGTTRAAGLAGYLHQRYGISLNGIVLVSPVLDFSTIAQQPSDDLSYLLFLPTYAATAWHHRLLPPLLQNKSLEQVLAEVEAFSLSDYALFLLKGDAVSAQEEERVLTGLSAYTALPPDLIRKENYRIDWADFSLNLLGDPNRLVGRMNTTVTGLNPNPSSPMPVFDPSLDPLYGPFTSAMNAYVRDVLAFESDETYEFLNAEVNRQWDWGSGIQHEQGFVDVTKSLKEAMVVNPYLAVYIASGTYDLATPYFAAAYTLNHMRLQERKSQVMFHTYPAGHMLFTSREALKALTADITVFYQKALQQ